MTAEEWKSYGKFVTIDNNNIFVIDTDESSSKRETIVILHGYPVTSFDFYDILLLLKEHYRVVIHDHFGFGFSDLPNTYCYSLIDQANVCIELWHKLRLKNFTILASQFGGMIAKEILYKKNANLVSFNIKSIVFSNSSDNKQLYDNLDTINSLVKNKKLSKYREVLINYKNKDFFNSKEDNETNEKYKSDTKIETIWKKFNELESQKEILVLSSYNEEIYLYWHRWIKALKDSTIPIKIFWRKDDIANIKEILLNIATFQKDNIQIIENDKCFVIEREPKSWLLMILKEIDRSLYYTLKETYFKS